MRAIKLCVETGFSGCIHEDIVYVEDNTSDDDLNEMARELMMDNIEYGWEEIREEADNGQ